MTFAFALITVGVILGRSGWTNRSIAATIRSDTAPEPKIDASDILGSMPHATGGKGAPIPTGGTLGGLASTVRATGTITFDGKPVAAWIAPILKYGRAHGWKGHVTSGWRSFAEQTRIYNSGVRPAAKPGSSNHEKTVFPGGAVDVTEADQLSAILLKSPYSKFLVHAGPKDPPHFSYPHNGSY